MKLCEFILNLLISALGAFVGVCGAYIIYRAQVQRENKNEENKNKVEAKNFFEYYILLLKSTLLTIRIQMQCLSEYIDEQQKSYTVLRAIKKVSFNDFERIRKLDQVNLFKTWMHVFPEKNIEKIKSYQSLNAELDYLEEITNNIEHINAAHSKESYETLCKANDYVMQLVEKLSNHIKTKIAENEGKLSPDSSEFAVYNLLINHYERSNKIIEGKNYSMEDALQTLLIPLESIFVENEDVYPYDIQLLYKNIRCLLESVKLQTQNVIKQYQDRLKEMEKHLIGVEKYMRPMKKGLSRSMNKF